MKEIQEVNFKNQNSIDYPFRCKIVEFVLSLQHIFVFNDFI